MFELFYSLKKFASKLTKRLIRGQPVHFLLLVYFFFCSASSEGQTAQNLTLKDCIGWAKENHPAMQKKMLIEQRTDQEIKLLNRNYFPQTAINAQASYQNVVTQITGIEFPGVQIPVPPKDQYRFTLDVNQSIWDGGLTEAIKAVTEANQTVAQQQENINLFKLEEQVSNLFFGALIASRLEENASILRSSLEAQYDKLQAAVENGTAIPAQLQTIEAKILELDQQVLEAQQNYQAAIESIELLTGRDLEQFADLAVPEIALIRLQAAERPEIRLLSAQQATLSANDAVIKARYRPKLNAFVQLGYGRPGLNFLNDDFDDFTIIGAQATIPLVQLYGKNNRIERQQNLLQRSIIAEEKEQYILQFKIQQTNKLKEIEKLESAIESDKKIIALRTDIRTAAEAQLDNGVITVSDYIEKVNEEDLAKQQLIIHEVQLIRARQQWNFLAGHATGE